MAGGEKSSQYISHVKRVWMSRYSPRPVLTASRPSQTMAQIGPLFMSIAELATMLGLAKHTRISRQLTSDQAGEEGLGLEVIICEGGSVCFASPISRRTYIVQCFSRCSLPGVTSLMATSLKLYDCISTVRVRVGAIGSFCLPSGLEAADDGADQSTLEELSVTVR